MTRYWFWNIQSIIIFGEPLIKLIFSLLLSIDSLCKSYNNINSFIDDKQKEREAHRQKGHERILINLALTDFFAHLTMLYSLFNEDAEANKLDY